MAFSIVFLAHAGLGGVIPGGFGVTIFFFLSGYLITTLYAEENSIQTGRIHLRQFYVRRVLRIFPPFYITLTILVIATLAGLLPGKLAGRGSDRRPGGLPDELLLRRSSRPRPPEWPAGS